MKNKRFKRTQRKNSKYTQIKRFNPPAVRFRKRRAAAVEQEAEARYQYHQLRLLLNKKALLPMPTDTGSNA